MSTFPEFATIEEIKARMPVTYVLYAAGHEPVDRSGRDLMYLTPWRQDSNPSLACYASDDDGVVDRWRDMARSEGGDMLDLIGMLDSSRESFADQLAMARTLYVRFLEGDWVAPEPLPSVGSFDVDAARAEMAEWAAQEDPGELESWMRERDDAVSALPAGLLRDTFRVSFVGGEVKAPFFDKDGEFVAYKYRRPGEKFMSPAGTRGMWTVFYGEWLDDGERPVVVCEGEPDVWSGTGATRDYVFLGLPSGAGTRPEKMQSRLVGRRVYIALDGDEAGRDASTLWADYLREDNEVFIVPVPEGRDLSSVADIPGLLARARRYESEMRGIVEIGGRYRRVSNNGDPGMELSDFVIDPVRVMIDQDGGMSYEVTDGARDLLLVAGDLGSKNQFRKWAHRHGLVWSGSDTDVAVLASRLKARSMFVPQESASDIAGYHDGHIVWDGGSIGDSPVRYVPGASIVNLDIRVTEGRGDHRLIYAMREMNDRKVVDPILAWAAVAPFRSLLPQFPVLNITGVSGSGKTTTAQAIIPVLTGSHIFQTLTSSTPYAVESLVNATNGFPVVFDEYRPGARTATLERLEQLARDAYDGNPSAKSMGGDRWNEIAYIRTEAPIVIAGEQSITETSHAERMILVDVVRPKVRDPRHERALRFVQDGEDGTLAYSFLSFVCRSILEDGVVKVTPSGPVDLPDRVRYNLGVLDLGWRILNDFLAMRGAAGLDAPDWSGVVGTVEAATSTNPTLDALEWALGDRFASENVWIEDDILYVQVSGFVADVRRSGAFVLPGNNGRTISNLLAAEYGAEQTRKAPPFGGQYKRVWAMPAGNVFPDNEGE